MQPDSSYATRQFLCDPTVCISRQFLRNPTHCATGDAMGETMHLATKSKLLCQPDIFHAGLYSALHSAQSLPPRFASHIARTVAEVVGWISWTFRHILRQTRQDYTTMSLQIVGPLHIRALSPLSQRIHLFRMCSLPDPFSDHHDTSLIPARANATTCAADDAWNAYGDRIRAPDVIGRSHALKQHIGPSGMVSRNYWHVCDATQCYRHATRRFSTCRLVANMSGGLKVCAQVLYHFVSCWGWFPMRWGAEEVHVISCRAARSMQRIAEAYSDLFCVAFCR